MASSTWTSWLSPLIDSSRTRSLQSFWRSLVPLMPLLVPLVPSAGGSRGSFAAPMLATLAMMTFGHCSLHCRSQCSIQIQCRWILLRGLLLRRRLHVIHWTNGSRHWHRRASTACSLRSRALFSVSKWPIVVTKNGPPQYTRYIVDCPLAGNDPLHAKCKKHRNAGPAQCTLGAWEPIAFLCLWHCAAGQCATRADHIKHMPKANAVRDFMKTNGWCHPCA